jgi:hypothetical protein
MTKFQRKTSSKSNQGPLSIGVAFTISTPSKTARATSQLIDCLDRIYDKLAAQTGGEGQGSSSSSGRDGLEPQAFAEELANELEMLKKTPKRFKSGGDLCRGVAFVKCNFGSSSIRPSQLVWNLLNNTETVLPSLCSRLVPFDFVCPPHPRNFEDLIRAHVKGYVMELFKGSEGSELTGDSDFAGDKYTWRLEYNKHNMSSLPKSEVLKVLMEELPGSPAVMGAKYHVLVDVNPGICGVSVVSDFERLENYNVLKVLQQRKDAEMQAEWINRNNQDI